METQELQNIWKAYDRKLEKSLALNLHCIEAIQTQKAKSKLKELLAPRIAGVFAGIVWALFLGALVWAGFSHLYFSVSLGMIILITLAAVFCYVYDIALISGINQSESITETQNKLALLQLSMIRCVRISFLQLPFYSTFFLSNDMLFGGGTWLFILQILIVGSFTLLAIWLYRTIHVGNLNKKWVRALLGGSGRSTVEKALSFIAEIEEFKKDQQ